MSEIPEAEETVMEVHHHHSGHSHQKKKWTEYFFEFFMLFLAVMAGFFAENLREHKIEHKRAKELAQSLYDDFKADTTALRSVIDFSENKILRLDSALNLLRMYPEHFNDTAFYMNITSLIRVNTFLRTGATFEQVKSSGFLRYFDQSLVNIFNEYEVAAKKVREREDIDNSVAINTLIPYTAELLNVEVAYDIFNDQPISHELYFKNFDQTNIDILKNYAVLAKRGRDRALIEYNNLYMIALKALEALEKEYHPE